MSGGIKNTPVNFVLPLQLETGEQANVFIPQPIMSELTLISRVLSYIFNQMDTLAMNVFIADYERIIDEALYDLKPEHAQKVKGDITRFFERCLAGAFCDLKDVKNLTDRELGDLKAIILFISALYRYAYTRTQMQSEELKAFFTSLTQAEWSEQLSTRDKSLEGETLAVEVSITQ